MSRQILKQAIEVLRRSGLGQAARGEPLYGGANNRLSRLDEGDHSFVVKEYGPVSSNGLDRFIVEMAFYDYLESTDLSIIPQRLAVDVPARAAIFRFIEGQVASVEQEPQYALAFIEFLELINSGQVSGSHLQPAAEACFSIGQHLEVIDWRLKHLTKQLSFEEANEELRGFVEVDVTNKWSHLKSSVHSAVDADSVLNEVRPNHRWLSPSDIGWHNTILSPEHQLYFIDFEYAGWDDPAKTLSDLFEHPDRPLAEEYVQVYLDRSRVLTEDESLYERFYLLRPIYRFKWLLIVLNEFMPERWQRRVFSMGKEAAKTRFKKQYQKAVNLLNSHK